MPHPLEVLFDNILHSRPATADEGIGQYFHSHGFSFTRYPAIDGVPLRSIRYAEWNLAAMPNPEQLGPYERQVLAEAIHAPSRFVILMGYEGSGKTSAILSVFNAFKKSRKYAPLAAFPELRLREMRNRLVNARVSHLVIDLERLWKDVEEVEKLGGDHAKQVQALYYQWALRLPLVLNGVFERTTKAGTLSQAGTRPSEILVDLVEFSVLLSNGGSALSNKHGLLYAIEAAAEHLPAPIKSGSNPEVDFQRVKAAARNSHPNCKSCFGMQSGRLPRFLWVIPIDCLRSLTI